MFRNIILCLILVAMLSGCGSIAVMVAEYHGDPEIYTGPYSGAALNFNSMTTGIPTMVSNGEIPYWLASLLYVNVIVDFPLTTAVDTSRLFIAPWTYF